MSRCGWATSLRDQGSLSCRDPSVDVARLGLRLSAACVLPSPPAPFHRHADDRALSSGAVRRDRDHQQSAQECVCE